jgi:DNA-binding transcriptional regulator YiaG
MSQSTALLGFIAVIMVGSHHVYRTRTGGYVMSNVAKVLKAEIARISKREAKSATQGIGKSNTWLRKIVADLKKRVVLLEKENRGLVAAMKKHQIESPPKADKEEGKKARFASRGIRALRKKLRLSQADFGKLVGTTTGAVYLWEKKDGPLSLRDKTKAAILSIRGLGAREAKERLGKGKTKSKASVPKAKKAR